MRNVPWTLPVDYTFQFIMGWGETGTYIISDIEIFAQTAPLPEVRGDDIVFSPFRRNGSHESMTFAEASGVATVTVTEAAERNQVIANVFSWSIPNMNHINLTVTGTNGTSARIYLAYGTHFNPNAAARLLEFDGTAQTFNIEITDRRMILRNYISVMIVFEDAGTFTLQRAWLSAVTA